MMWLGTLVFDKVISDKRVGKRTDVQGKGTSRSVYSRSVYGVDLYSTVRRDNFRSVVTKSVPNSVIG